MSTVDTHLNWGASYLTHDLYRRFVAPDASQSRLVWVSRLSVMLLTAMGVVVASRIDSIEQAWRLFIALGAGLGLPSMLRWFWWRANAWTEIAGIVAAVSSALVLYPLFPDARDEYLLLAIVAISVQPLIRAGMQKEALDKLLQTGDYTVESKWVTRRVGWFAGAYWCGVTAVYLGVSFRHDSWNTSWWIWAVAGVLFAAVWLAVRAWAGRSEE